MLDGSGDGLRRGIERILQVSVELPQLLVIKQRFAAPEAHAQQELPNAAFRVALRSRSGQYPDRSARRRPLPPPGDLDQVG